MSPDFSPEKPSETPASSALLAGREPLPENRARAVLLGALGAKTQAPVDCRSLY